MSNDVHVYAYGNDPYMIKFGELRYFVHAGSPPSAKPEPEPDPEHVDIGEILTPTRPGSTYRDLVVRNLDDPELLAVLRTVEDGTDLRVHLQTGPTDQVRLDGLLEGLTDSAARGVEVHVIPEDSGG